MAGSNASHGVLLEVRPPSEWMDTAITTNSPLASRCIAASSLPARALRYQAMQVGSRPSRWMSAT